MLSYVEELRSVTFEVIKWYEQEPLEALLERPVTIKAATLLVKDTYSRK